MYTLRLGGLNRPLKNDEGLALCTEWNGDCERLKQYGCTSLDGPRCSIANPTDDFSTDVDKILGDFLKNMKDTKQQQKLIEDTTPSREKSKKTGSSDKKSAVVTATFIDPSTGKASTVELDASDLGNSLAGIFSDPKLLSRVEAQMQQMLGIKPKQAKDDKTTTGQEDGENTAEDGETKDDEEQELDAFGSAPEASEADVFGNLFDQITVSDVDFDVSNLDSTSNEWGLPIQTFVLDGTGNAQPVAADQFLKMFSTAGQASGDNSPNADGKAPAQQQPQSQSPSKKESSFLRAVPTSAAPKSTASPSSSTRSASSSSPRVAQPTAEQLAAAINSLKQFMAASVPNSARPKPHSTSTKPVAKSQPATQSGSSNSNGSPNPPKKQKGKSTPSQ